MHDLETLKKLNENAVSAHDAGIERAARAIYVQTGSFVYFWEDLTDRDRAFWIATARSAHSAYMREN